MLVGWPTRIVICFRLLPGPSHRKVASNVQAPPLPTDATPNEPRHPYRQAPPLLTEATSLDTCHRHGGGMCEQGWHPLGRVASVKKGGVCR